MHAAMCEDACHVIREDAYFVVREGACYVVRKDACFVMHEYGLLCELEFEFGQEGAAADVRGHPLKPCWREGCPEQARTSEVLQGALPTFSSAVCASCVFAPQGHRSPRAG